MRKCTHKGSSGSLLMLLGVAFLITMVTSDNCPSTFFCEFELKLQPQLAASWPGVSTADFLASLGSLTGASSMMVNLTRIFDSVVIGSYSPTGVPNASRVAFDTVTTIVAAANGGGSGTAAQQFVQSYQVTGALYGYQPVIVPAYLRVLQEPDQTIFAIIGGVAAVLFVAQIAYGIYHFKGIGFLIGLSNERD